MTFDTSTKLLPRFLPNENKLFEKKEPKNIPNQCCLMPFDAGIHKDKKALTTYTQNNTRT